MFNKIAKYLAETKAELLKVTWPTRQQAIRLTLAVIFFSIILAAFIGVMDFIFSQSLQKIILKG